MAASTRQPISAEMKEAKYQAPASAQAIIAASEYHRIGTPDTMFGPAQPNPGIRPVCRSGQLPLPVADLRTEVLRRTCIAFPDPLRTSNPPDLATSVLRLGQP